MMRLSDRCVLRPPFCPRRLLHGSVDGSVWIVDPGDLIGAAPPWRIYQGVAKEFGSATSDSSPPNFSIITCPRTLSAGLLLIWATMLMARCIERAAEGGRVEGSSARGRSQEWDPSCC